jgi:hypothetical protein
VKKIRAINLPGHTLPVQDHASFVTANFRAIEARHLETKIFRKIRKIDGLGATDFKQLAPMSRIGSKNPLEIAMELSRDVVVQASATRIERWRQPAFLPFPIPVNLTCSIPATHPCVPLMTVRVCLRAVPHKTSVAGHRRKRGTHLGPIATLIIPGAIGGIRSLNNPFNIA